MKMKIREAVVIKGGRRLQEIDITDGERRSMDLTTVSTSDVPDWMDCRDLYGDRLRNTSLTVGSSENRGTTKL